MSNKSNKKRKPYERPTLKKLTAEEAKKLLQENADFGRDAAAKAERKAKRGLPSPNSNPF